MPSNTGMKTKKIVGSSDDISYFIKELQDRMESVSIDLSTIAESAEHKVFYTQPRFANIADTLHIQHVPESKTHKLCAIALVDNIQKAIQKATTQLQIILYNGDNIEADTVKVLTFIVTTGLEKHNRAQKKSSA